MNIGENVKKYRLLKNLTRKDLANGLEVSESTISRYENGKREPNMDTLKKISEILEVPLNELLVPNKTGIQELIENSIYDKKIESINELSKKTTIPLKRIESFYIGGEYTPEDYDKIIAATYGSYYDYMNSPRMLAIKLGKQRSEELETLNHLYLVLKSYYGTDIHKIDGNASKTLIGLKVNDTKISYSEKEFQMFLEYVCKNFATFKSTIEIIQNNIENN